MQRRRLSPLARVVFYTLYQCEPQSGGPVVFSSTMGEIQRTQGILEAIADGDPVSPAAFSLSVHNAVVGLWSLVNGVTSPMISLAPVEGSPVPALLEAAGMLAEGWESVLVVFCEEAYPEFYRPFLNSPTGPTSLALQLVPSHALAPGEGLRLTLQRIGPGGKDGMAVNGSQALQQVLLGGGGPLVLVEEPAAAWQLSIAG
mgnify:CR=1 FL=1